MVPLGGMRQSPTRRLSAWNAEPHESRRAGPCALVAGLSVVYPVLSFVRGIRDPMANAAFSIRFEMPGDGASIARVRDFGEELSLRMRKQNVGDVSDPDTAIDVLTVSLSSPRHLGPVRMLIRKTLTKHRLDAHAVVVAI